MNYTETSIYDVVKEFKKKYPLTIAWRLKEHAKIIKMHLNTGEEILYMFPAQRNEGSLDLFNTYIIALTNKRIMLGRKRLVYGYFFTAITPDMFNDLTVKKGLFWGKIIIDTIKEEVIISNIDPKALPEIETNVTEQMMKEKKKYKEREEKRL